MIVPIVKIPATIADGLHIYRNLFPRSEMYRHIEEYCTGLVVLAKPSLNLQVEKFSDLPAIIL